MEDKKKMHIETENLAVPEIRYDDDDDFEDDEEGMGIDYLGAVPEVHIKNNNKKLSEE